MNALRFPATGVMACLLIVGAQADETKEKIDNTKMLIGKWEVTKATGDAALTAAGVVIEFTKDGNMTVTLNDAKRTQQKATYKVEADNILVNMIIDGKDQKLGAITIKKLSDRDLILEQKKESNDRVAECKRVK
jgi:uncharacterized protein (TIGR03066 family)